MKLRTTLLVALLFVSAMALKAQDDANYTHGVRAGWSNAGLFMDGDQVPASGDSQTGFYVGTFRTTKIVPMLHWYKGFEYQQMGARVDDDNFRKLHYLSLPTALRVKLGPVFAQVGIAANFKVGESITVLGQEMKTDDNKAEWYDFPWHTGLGFKIGPITLDARYQWGLNDIDDTGVRNQQFQLGAGLSF